MKIIVSKIPEKGIDIHSSETSESLDISPSDLILDDAVCIDATVRRDGDIFFIDGTIKTVIHLTCSRCGGDFSYPMDTFFHCHEEPINRANTEVDLTLKKRDMDIGHYAGEEVELNTLFREQLILAVPMRPLCKPDCLGLCHRCGQNLNINRCDCPPEEVTNPFSAIKKLFDED